MAHQLLNESGIAQGLNITTVSDANNPHSKYLNKTIRFSKVDTIGHGTMMYMYDFIVKELQKDYVGLPCCRIYAIDRDSGVQIDVFGKCIDLFNDETEFDVV